LGAADRCPRRGGTREAVLEAERPAQAGREAAGFARAGPCWEMEAPLGFAGCPPGPRWAREGCESAWMCWPLQPVRPRARDRRCPSGADWGNAQPARRLSRVVAMAGLRFLVDESRSGPDLLKLGWRGARKGGHATGCAVRRGLHPLGHTASTGFEAICCCARGSNWSQKSAAALGGASRKRAAQETPAMEGALDRGSAPPLTRRRAEAVLVLPLSVGSQIP
jgi:hypothetical protein